MLDDGFSGLLGGPRSQPAMGGGGSLSGPFLQFSIPCLNVEDQKGPPSFQYIFYELPLPAFPFQFPEGEGFYVANGWCNGTGAHVQRMKILDPSRENVLVDTNDQPFTLKRVEEPFMAVNFITGMRIEREGAYWMQVFLDNQLRLEYPLQVRKADSQPQPPTK